MTFVNQKEYAKLQARVSALEEKIGAVEVPNIEEVLTLHDVYGDELADLLLNGGFNSVIAVSLASDEELLAIKGLGPATVKRIRGAG